MFQNICADSILALAFRDFSDMPQVVHFPINQELFNGSYNWHYCYPADSDGVEIGTVRGMDVALPFHFHEEDQLTFVLSGRRRFVIGNMQQDIPSGSGIHIPYWTPHRSLSDVSDLVCINMYLTPNAYAIAELLMGLKQLWQRKSFVSRLDIVALAAQCRKSDTPALSQDRRIYIEPDVTVGHAAQLANMSREGFSRRFKKLYGMSPQAYQVMTKLNNARRLLRIGEPLAAVSAEAGFSDQSHMGRHFLRFFGVTPGLYRLR